MTAFIIWAAVGVAFILMGIYDLCSKKQKPFGFFANTEPPQVTDIKKYNRALGILWCVFGIIFILLGIPLLSKQNSPLIVITIIGSMFEAIGAMAVYILGIEKRYGKRG